jgi:hypothetical protein
MGSGLGCTQRAVVELFENEPNACLTVAEITARVYPGQPVTRSHTNALNRVLRQLAPVLGLTCRRVSRFGRAGSLHIWGRN